MPLDRFVERNNGDENEIDIQKDLKEAFADFGWNVKGIIDENGEIHPIPKIPQVVTGIFESFGKRRIKELARTKYKCKVIEGGSRQYPDLTLVGGKLGEKKIALEIKTARRNKERPNRSSRMSLGSCAGYFLYPKEKKRGCKYPYGQFSEHWVVGCVYTWNEKKDSLHMVSDVEVIVQPKWKIASKSTATGDTAAIGSVNNIADLKAGKGEFDTEEEFEEYWRKRGRSYQR